MIELFESVYTIAIFIQWELREGPRNRKKKNFIRLSKPQLEMVSFNRSVWLTIPCDLALAIKIIITKKISSCKLNDQFRNKRK